MGAPSNALHLTWDHKDMTIIEREREVIDTLKCVVLDLFTLLVTHYYVVLIDNCMKQLSILTQVYSILWSISQSVLI
jgi:hypothetical protein